MIVKMEFIIGTGFWIILSISNVVFLYLWLKAKNESRKPRPESIELQEFLYDLMSGSAIISVSRIAPHDVLLRARSRTHDR